MRIHNIRRGFATNSSSTHSIILLPQGEKVTDQDVSEYNFGWDHFTAASREAKLGYVVSTIASNLSGSIMSVPELILGFKDPFWKETFAPLLSKSVDAVFNDFSSAYVDHQSCVSLPKEFSSYSPTLHEGFLKAWVQFMMQDRIVILGGNDNTDELHPLGLRGETLDYRHTLPVDMSRDTFICREETTEINGIKMPWFTLFDTHNGTKNRISFPFVNGAGKLMALSDSDVDKASTPELVDIKITDFCDIGCKYCYQGSTKRGKHGFTKTIEELASVLGYLNVFEVAIGGGEPTQHPDFFRILNSFKQRGITPNFTTRSTDWFDSPQFSKILETMGAVAFSVNNGDDVKAIKKKIKESDFNSVNPQRIHFQYVIGTGTDDDLKSVFKQANGTSVTLLGYKTTGRGKSFLSMVNPQQDWAKIAKACNVYHVGIDTALAQQSAQRLQELNIPKNTYYVHEGKFSMYIDAVNLTMGPSSYCGSEEFVKLPIEDRKKTYSKYSSYENSNGHHDSKVEYTGQDLLAGTETVKTAIVDTFKMW